MRIENYLMTVYIYYIDLIDLKIILVQIQRLLQTTDTFQREWGHVG